SAASFSAYDGVYTPATDSDGGQSTLIGTSGGTDFYPGIIGTRNVNNSGTPTAVFNSVLMQCTWSTASPFLSVASGYKIGRDRTYVCWPGWIGEVVAFAGVLSAGNRAALYTNQQAYWQTGLLLDTLGVT